MKGYLNSEERQQGIYIVIMYGIISGIMEQGEKNMSKEERKSLRYIRTYIEKYLEGLKGRVGEREINRILKESDKFKIIMQARENDGYYRMDKDTIEQIANYAVEAKCFGCNREDWDECKLYKWMRDAGMGKVDEVAGRCVYYYEKV